MRPLTFLALVILLSSCGKDAHEPADTPLYNKIHGKYHPVTVTSNIAVDINFDSVASTNLLSELEGLKNSELIIHTIPSKLIMQFWPEQYFSDNRMPSTYNPGIVVNYANQGTAREFMIDNELTEIEIVPDPYSSNPRFVIADQVKVLGEGLIGLHITKNLYTRTGWVTTGIDILYQRYMIKT